MKVLVVDAYRRLTRREFDDVTDEAGSLFEFLAPGLPERVQVKNP